MSRRFSISRYTCSTRSICKSRADPQRRQSRKALPASNQDAAETIESIVTAGTQNSHQRMTASARNQPIQAEGGRAHEAHWLSHKIERHKSDPPVPSRPAPLSGGQQGSPGTRPLEWSTAAVPPAPRNPPEVQHSECGITRRYQGGGCEVPEGPVAKTPLIEQPFTSSTPPTQGVFIPGTPRAAANNSED